MYLNFLKPNKKSSKKKMRLGRGQGSGKGGTCGRGHKGAKSRSGYSKKLGFEGGQNPIQRRLPKFGFKNRNKKKYCCINLDTIQNLIDKKIIVDNLVNKEVLIKYNLLKRNCKLIKILAGKGHFKSLITIEASKFSKKSILYIKNAGGKLLYK
ncbi:50S ribosomal protein L15 [Blattabacterium cuenoti]|uniref:50S ribosomal protein L15 n=1 Tax=Blattabacterium cuenoti TaxID=1653831 RepID=UPI00163C31A4|nr:50S ribosomal protein L15 [Blattabacterium cuenoti]